MTILGASEAAVVSVHVPVPGAEGILGGVDRGVGFIAPIYLESPLPGRLVQVQLGVAEAAEGVHAVDVVASPAVLPVKQGLGAKS